MQVPQKNRKPSGAKVVNLDQYRTRSVACAQKIEIDLLPGGGVGYSTVGLGEEDTLRALIGCYVVAGRLIQTLSDRMKKCGTNDCGAD